MAAAALKIKGEGGWSVERRAPLTNYTHTHTLLLERLYKQRGLRIDGPSTAACKWLWVTNPVQPLFKLPHKQPTHRNANSFGRDRLRKSSLGFIFNHHHPANHTRDLWISLTPPSVATQWLKSIAIIIMHQHHLSARGTAKPFGS